jgi:uncharacterized protein
MSISLTGLIYDVNALQILEALKDPMHADKNLIILFSMFYSLFSFFIIPTTYLFLYNRNSLRIFWRSNKIRFTPLLLLMITVFTIIPLMTMLMKLNNGIEFPSWLAELEGYFKDSEENARQLTSALLYSRESKGLIIAILIMAVMPGIVEELFFRGIVQNQLHDILKNSHHAILVSAFLFSFFHFQFYGFIPRLILGGLLGYIFAWSGNIWYSCTAHVANNLIAVLGSYFLEPQFLNPDGGGFISIVLTFLSLGITVLTILCFKGVVRTKILTEEKLII